MPQLRKRPGIGWRRYQTAPPRLQKRPSCRCLLTIRERFFAKKEIGITEPIRPSRCIASSSGHEKLGGRNVACQIRRNGRRPFRTGDRLEGSRKLLRIELVQAE